MKRQQNHYSSWTWTVIVSLTALSLHAGDKNITDPKNDPAQEKTTLPEIIVTAEREGSETATRTDTPITSTPLSVNFVPRQVIEDQNASRIRDAYRNVSSVIPVKTASRGIMFEDAYIRGFSQRLYVDGVNLYTCPLLNMESVQQVEVLKGPSSSLYGAMEVGGLVNVIPRLPERTEFTTISGEAGSYDLYRGSVDYNEPVNEDLAFRFTSSFEDSDSFRDYLHKQSLLIAPSISWDISDDTHLTTWLWYQHLDRPVDPGCIFSYTGEPVGPISRNLAGPSTDQNQPIDDVVMGVHFDHNITPDITLREKLLVHFFDSEMDCIRFGRANSKNYVTPSYDRSSFQNLEFDLVSDVLWRFDLGPTSHKLLFGTELSCSDYYYDRLTQSLTPIYIYDPVYPKGPYNPIPGTEEQRTLTEMAAGFVQDEIDALDNRLHLLTGGRVDYVDQFYRAWSDGNEYNQYDVGFSGRAGIMYDLTTWMSPYVNTSSSFNPNTAGRSSTVSGDPLDPTTGLQYETGLKFSLLDKRLLLTCAAYEITKDNIPVTDENNPGFSLNGGELRSRGFELDILGQITPALQVVGNYAHTDTEVIKSDTLPEGAPFADIPEDSGSMWFKYTFQEGPLKNFGAGSGVFACSDRSGNNNHTFDVAGYARWDAGTWYTHTLSSGQEVKVQFNLYNILDKTYYESGAGQPGPPISATGKVSVTF